MRPVPNADVPTIVVEFVSPGKAAWRRDYIEKRDEYLEAGVLEYWVIDRFCRQLTVYSLHAGKPTERVVNEPEIYRPELLPGFELPLAAADRWGQVDQQ
jgi:Uma2 family endonuclease